MYAKIADVPNVKIITRTEEVPPLAFKSKHFLNKKRGEVLRVPTEHSTILNLKPGTIGKLENSHHIKVYS